MSNYVKRRDPELHNVWANTIRPDARDMFEYIIVRGIRSSDSIEKAVEKISRDIARQFTPARDLNRIECNYQGDPNFALNRAADKTLNEAFRVLGAVQLIQAYPQGIRPLTVLVTKDGKQREWYFHILRSMALSNQEAQENALKALAAE